MVKTIWTATMLEYLQEHFALNRSQDLADTLGVSLNAVRAQAALLGLSKEKSLKSRLAREGNPRILSEEKKSYLRENYASIQSQKLADTLGISLSYVRTLAYQYRLRKDPSLIAKMARETQLSVDNPGRFKKGRAAENKGQKLPPDAKRASTCFQKGHLPNNKQPNGTISRRKHYMAIKVAGKFVEYHRYLWEQAHGAIPKDRIVVFIDGNRDNCTLSNLELISRAEHALRNKPEIPNELIPNYLAIRDLNKIISQKKEEQNAKK
jgi:hypothetical protein